MIKGTEEFAPPTGDRANYHVDRAFWLTAKVETGARFGSVMAYDGTGMTIGLDQHVAVYPKELSKPDDGNNLDDQGTLWKLLRRLELIPGERVSRFVQLRENLWNAFSATNWYLAQDGVLRLYDSGAPVNGHAIRDEFTPRRGKPTTKFQKEEARYWALLFHDLLAHSASWKAQVEYGKEHLVKRTKRRRVNVYANDWITVEAFYPRDVTALRVSDWSEEQDLAMCMYQSHSVNAPSVANNVLAKTFKHKDANPGDTWARRLIRGLGTSKYGRWDDDIKYGRYQRTRSAARASGLWSRRLFDGKKAIMPKDLRG